MSDLPKVVLHFTKNGMCEGVSINGYSIPFVLKAQVDAHPGEITKLFLEVAVGELESLPVEEAK